MFKDTSSITVNCALVFFPNLGLQIAVMTDSHLVYIYIIYIILNHVVELKLSCSFEVPYF